MRTAIKLCSLALATLWTSWLFAQTVDVNFKVRCVADPDKVAKALIESANSNKEPDITGGKVCLASQLARPEGEEKEYTFNSEISLVVEHAPETSFDEIGQPNPGDLVFFMGGKPLHGTHPRVGPSAIDPDEVTTTLLTYRIVHDVTTKAAQDNWKEILMGSKSRKVLAVSTGLETGAAAQSQATILFTSISTGRAWLFAVVALVILFVFFFVAKKTGALRDKEPAPAGFPPQDRAYSLSRCQMAGWTVLAVLAYLFVWLLTGQYNATVPASVVTLMGISLSTYGLASAVDISKSKTNAAKAQALSAEAAVGGAGAPNPAHVAAAAQRAQVAPTENLVADLATSSEGASLHRLQMIIWTLALMVVFVVTVWKTLGMPDFDSTLLALMGISSGAYVGLKVPENKV
ncbi:MAG TPA: hypothetical protein VF532_12475 [Candidatus Angelobacter sp.]